MSAGLFSPRRNYIWVKRLPYGLAEGVCETFAVIGRTFLINCGAVTIGRIATGPL